MTVVTGRFAPSPTGPLHLGSLVAAVGSFLSARSVGGAWLVRMEDLDATRVVRGAADEILHALELFALEWDGRVVYQSERVELYEAAVDDLRRRRLVYDCACSRADLQRSASAPAVNDVVDAERVYSGRCRGGLAPGSPPRAVRFRVEQSSIAFCDRVFGEKEENVSDRVGDFVVRRSDGPYAYQLAVVVDDFSQSVTEVVRGGDLLSSTARQIALQEALGYARPEYGHLPLVVGSDGAKLGKRHGALSIATLTDTRRRFALQAALRILGIEVELHEPRAMLREAVERFDWSVVRAMPANQKVEV